MKIKSGVILNGLQTPMRKVLINAEAIWKELGQELVITSGLEGTHSAGSLHYYGYAVDLRTRYFDLDQIDQAANALITKLGYGYTVVVHETHMHIHYNGGLLNDEISDDMDSEKGGTDVSNTYLARNNRQG